MDTNLEDSLHLDSDMGVDFDQSQEAVIDQDGMTLQGSSHEGMAMEFEQIEDQSMLMDTGNEEIIVSDFTDQFTLQEYQTQDVTGNPKTDILEDAVSKGDSAVYQDLPMEQPVMVPASGVLTRQLEKGMVKPKIVSVKAAVPTLRAIAPKKQTVVVTKAIAPKQVAIAAPKQVAIAPKPPKLVTFGKQYAIAPKPTVAGVKPVTIITNKAGQVVKKVTIPTSQDSATGNAVLSIGKQLVMLPGGTVGAGGGKIKLVTGGPAPAGAIRLLAANSPDKAQLISTQSVTGQNPKQMMTKVVIQGSSGGEQSAVLTKLAGAGGGAPRFVMQPKTVPVPITLTGTGTGAGTGGAKLSNVVIGSPSKAGIRFTQGNKPHLVVKTPPSKDGVVTKKIVLTAIPQAASATDTFKPAQPALAPAPAPPAKTDMVKVSGVPLGQKTELHQINVPGKGMQYIRLVTSMGQAKQVVHGPKPSPTKTFVLTDAKGNRIQMEKMSTQPPPLTVTSGAGAGPAHASASAQTNISPRPKLVKIAPVWSKQGQAAMSRGGQSLLAPLSPAEPSAPTDLIAAAVSVEPDAEITKADEHCYDDGGHSEEITIDDVQPLGVELEAEITQADNTEEYYYDDRDHSEEIIIDDVQPQVNEPIDSKAALRQLIAETVGSDDARHSGAAPSDSQRQSHYDTHENKQYENGISMDQLPASQGSEHPLIVIPSYMKQDVSEESDHYNNVHDNSQQSPTQIEAHYTMQRQGAFINIDVDPYNVYQPAGAASPDNENSGEGGELGLRPRKACNCTKSQCLKLYCDCFANGEFCHRCNCTNCHNNLENEQLRQKAIKGCLDRNPNAFRPKIGKSKTGGPEIFRRHNKGCNCKRSGCLKNYCECYEAKIACSSICRCVGCRNVEESVERARRRGEARLAPPPPPPASAALEPAKQPCSFMTSEVIEAVCQCLIAAAVESPGAAEHPHSMPSAETKDPIRDVIDEFARCLQDIINASSQATPLSVYSDAHT